MRLEGVEPPPLSGQDPKSCASGRLTFTEIFCGERDLNPQPFRDKILSLARLPVSPPPRKISELMEVGTVPTSFKCSAELYLTKAGAASFAIAAKLDVFFEPTLNNSTNQQQTINYQERIKNNQFR